MSYQNMDHAAWVEDSNRSHKKRHATGRSKKALYWQKVPETLSPFQAKVMDILGIVFGGIYNAPIAWGSVQWNYGGHGLAVTLTHSNGLSTFDNSALTKLVFLCLEARIRGQVQPGGFKSITLSFWQREGAGAMHTRHPNLDEAVKEFRDYMPIDHRIFYRWPPLSKPDADQ